MASETWLFYIWWISAAFSTLLAKRMRPTKTNAHTHVNGTDVETRKDAVTQNTCAKQINNFNRQWSVERGR